jgi:hypothetical protein
MKQPYSYVSREMDKLYSKKFSENDLVSINNHCEFIVSFLHACEWTEDEYIQAMFDSDLSETSVDAPMHEDVDTQYSLS